MGKIQDELDFIETWDISSNWTGSITNTQVSIKAL